MERDRDRDKDRDRDRDDKSRRRARSSRDVKGARSSSSRDRPNVKKHQISYLLNDAQSHAQPSQQDRNDPMLDTLSLRDLRQLKHKQSRKTNDTQSQAPTTPSHQHRNEPMLDTQSLRDLRLHKQKQSRQKTTSTTTRVKSERSHASSSSRPQLYRCNQCKKDFFTKFDLDEHIARFHTPRIYKCEICLASFGEKGNLNDNERPWPCNECGLAFGFRDTLNRHIDAVHRGLRPFPCSDCHARFKKRAHLQRHEQTCPGKNKDKASSSKKP